MSFIKDFKSFLMKGDLVAMATAFVIALAFKAIITSMVNDLIMPIVGVLTGGTDFTQKFIALDGGNYETLKAAQDAGAAIITYGNLIQAIINFVIIAFFIFVVIRQYEKLKKKEEEAPAGPTQEQLLTEIRDELKSKNA